MADGTDLIDTKHRPEGSPESKRVRAVSRRDVVAGGGIGLGLLGVGALIGHETPRLRHADTASSSSTTANESAPSSLPTSRSFVSTDLVAPSIEAWQGGQTSAGLLFLDPLRDKGFQGMIVDDLGEPIWIAPASAAVAEPLDMTTLDVQAYQGKPVLTYWSGRNQSGHGVGECRILDTSYRTVATVRADGDTRADMHEFKLTSKSTALIITYAKRRADLRGIGGPKDGYIFDCHAQEIDVATGKVLLDWSALDHVDVDETYLGLTQSAGHDGTTEKRAFDPFHLNSVDDNGDRLLISMRHTHTLYAIDRAAGTVLWRFGGKRSDFDIPEGADFAWQHDARWHGDNGISMFDNHYYSGPGQSQGLSFSIDETRKEAALKARLTYNRHRGTAMGNVQLQSGGNVLVGWGMDPAATEFDEHGTPVLEMTLPAASYRVRRRKWTATPGTRPAIAARKDGSNIAVHLSWNGATEVSQWKVISESTSSASKTVVAPRTGFETTVLIAPTDSVSAVALDKSGRVLGRTAAASAL